MKSIPSTWGLEENLSFPVFIIPRLHPSATLKFCFISGHWQLQIIQIKNFFGQLQKWIVIQHFKTRLVVYQAQYEKKNTGYVKWSSLDKYFNLNEKYCFAF